VIHVAAENTGFGRRSLRGEQVPGGKHEAEHLGTTINERRDTGSDS
jgi:hypothetical protein